VGDGAVRMKRGLYVKRAAKKRRFPSRSFKSPVRQRKGEGGIKKGEDLQGGKSLPFKGGWEVPFQKPRKSDGSMQRGRKRKKGGNEVIKAQGGNEGTLKNGKIKLFECCLMLPLEKN